MLSMVGCGGGEKSESQLDLESNTNLPGSSNPSNALTLEVEDFISSLITSTDFRQFNGNEVEYSEDKNLKSMIYLNVDKEISEENIQEFGWGKAAGFSPSECEFYNIGYATTSRFIESNFIAGQLRALENVVQDYSNIKKAKIQRYIHSTLIFRSLNASEKIWETMLNTSPKCLTKEGYKMIGLTGKIYDQGDLSGKMYISDDKNIFLHLMEYGEIWDVTIIIKQGLSHDRYRFISEGYRPRNDNFESLEGLVQKSININAQIQNIAPTEVKLTKLSNHEPTQVDFIYPLL
jgi:hypothetical protein